MIPNVSAVEQIIVFRTEHGRADRVLGVPISEAGNGRNTAKTRES